MTLIPILFFFCLLAVGIYTLRRIHKRISRNGGEAEPAIPQVQGKTKS